MFPKGLYRADDIQELEDALNIKKGHQGDFKELSNRAIEVFERLLEESVLVPDSDYISIAVLRSQWRDFFYVGRDVLSRRGEHVFDEFYEYIKDNYGIKDDVPFFEKDIDNFLDSLVP